MAKKVQSYEYNLDEKSRTFVHVILTFEKGLRDFVVVLYTIEEGKKIPLVTYDRAHGFAHRDIRFLDEKDKRKKKPLPGIALEEQLDEALADVHKNWRRYLEEYKRRK